MKRVLVISDNEDLARAFIKIVNQSEIAAVATFQYRYSFVNRKPAQLIKLGFLPVNLKDTDAVDRILDDFDLVFSVHCKQIFPAGLVNRLECVNLHPGFNPFNKGWYPQVFSILNNQTAGATLHVMTEDVDGGPIISQKKIDVELIDTSLTLYKKIQQAEIHLLTEHIASILSGKFEATTCLEQGNFNHKSDFNRLCSLNLDAVGTLREHINLLRALSHPPFDNAFYSADSGKKVYVRIDLQQTI